MLRTGVQFAWVLRGDAKLLPGVGHGIGHPQFFGKRQANLRASGRGDPAFALQHLPRHIDLLGTDQGKNVLLPAVFSHQRRRQAQPAPCLEARRHLEDRRGEQVHLVVDDQAPVPLIEELQMREFGVLPRPPGHDVVGRHGHRPDVLRRAVVLAHLVGLERGLVQEFGDPLPGGCDARGQYERGGLDFGHAGHPHDRLAGPARQDDHARAASFAAAGVENPGRTRLVVPQGKGDSQGGLGSQRDWQRLAFAVSGQVLGRKADLDQGLLDAPACGRVQAEGHRR